ncbi:ribosome maturation factor RimP [Marispirochaeta sp.]|jgi:ribosome maturation factor RimP|uniref:ribosome maturation factor RimP n=1 Tax=Marispirochaeta sp. TaxID=2038653 RepID=UPI0029C84464|nr:ribosome maturation factor RimP [Marispirochaeta sp.]
MKEGTGISPELESTVDIIQGMGFSVVEAQCRPVKGTLQVVIYIYRPEGVSLDDCTKVYRTVMPRLEVAMDSRDISLEVSSPGISRNIKFFREFVLFSGRRIKVLTEGSSEWAQGELLRADDEEIVLAVGDGERRYGRTDIVKAKISEG